MKQYTFKFYNEDGVHVASQPSLQKQIGRRMPGTRPMNTHTVSALPTMTQ